MGSRHEANRFRRAALSAGPHRALAGGRAAEVDRVDVVTVEERIVELDRVRLGRGEDLAEPVGEAVVGRLG